MDAAQAIMNWFGCIVIVDPSIKAQHRTRVHGHLELLSEKQISQIEKVLKYTFKNKGLLVEAFTHDSCRRDHGETYQVRASLHKNSIPCILGALLSTTRCIDNFLYCCCREWSF